MGGRECIFGKKKFGSGEDEVAPAPIFEPHGLLSEPSFKVGVVTWVSYLSFRVDIGRTGHCVRLGEVLVVLGLLLLLGRTRLGERVVETAVAVTWLLLVKILVVAVLRLLLIVDGWLLLLRWLRW